MDEKITEKLIKLRKEHNLSQEQLADELGVSRQAVSKWERGEASPDTDNLIALARIYDTSLDSLLFDKPDEALCEEELENKALSLSEIKEKLENGEEVVVGGEIHKQDDRSHMDTAEGVVAGITVMLSCIVFFILGGVWGLWHPGWIVFLLFPLCLRLSVQLKRKTPVFSVIPYLLRRFICFWAVSGTYGTRGG